MFDFERDVSGRLVSAVRKHLPDSSGTPSLLGSIQQSHFRLRNVVLAMVRRGDFNVAVRRLTDILIEIAADHRYNFSNEESILGIDSLLVVLDALLAAFTQRMVDLGLLAPSAIESFEPMFRPLCSIYVWSSVSRVPPLEKSVALDLLAFMSRVMPEHTLEFPVAARLAENWPMRLADMLLNMAQYVYMSNPIIMHDAIDSALAEWDSPARIEWLLLSPTDSDSLDRYLRQVRSYLPRLESNDQQLLLKLVAISIMRSIVAKPACNWARGASVRNAITGFLNVVEKSRPFRALRVFRAHEAQVITVLEILRTMGHPFNNPTSPTSSSFISSSTFTSSSLNSHISSDDASTDEDVVFSSSPKERRERTMTSGFTQDLLSVSHIKMFERAVALVKRENPADKRAGSRVAAAEYIISLGFFGCVVSERAEGKQFLGLARDALPYVTVLLDDFHALSKQHQVMFVVFCSELSPRTFLKIVPTLDASCTLQILQVLMISSKPQTFSRVISLCKDNFLEYLGDCLKKDDCTTINFPLSLLIGNPEGVVPTPILQDVVRMLTVYAAKTPDINKNSREILYCFIEALVKGPGVDVFLDEVSVLMLKDNPVEVLRNPNKLHVFHELLHLLAQEHRFVPLKYLEDGGLLADRLESLRSIFMLCLCSDVSTAVETALKCLEMLQSDPRQSPAERDLVSELLDSMDQYLPSTVVMQKRMMAALAADSDQAFARLNESIRSALDSIEEKPMTYKLHSNLVRMRTATLSLEPEKVRSSFYMDIVRLDGKLLLAISGSLPLSSSLAKEFFTATTQDTKTLSAQIAPICGSQLCGKCQLYSWLLDCLEADHPCTAAELGLGDIASRAVSSLGSQSNSCHEIAVLKFVESAASYASRDKAPEEAIKLFSKVVTMILDRAWNADSCDHLVAALGTLFKHFEERDEVKLRSLVDKILRLNLTEVQIPILTSLLMKNLDHPMQFYDGISASSYIYRASIYEALTKCYALRNEQKDNTVEGEDFVMFLLENKPVLIALTDVCSVTGDDGLSVALLKSFKSYSKAAERRLVKLAMEHEVESASTPTELFRSNSVTMKIILEWLRSASSTYLSVVLAPALGSLRAASTTDDTDLDALFDVVMSRFRNRQMPIEVRWLIHLANEEVEQKFGPEVARHAIPVLIVMRFICPAIVAPHCFGVARRPPARHFASILRKFAIFLQKRGETVCELVGTEEGKTNASPCHTSEGLEALISSAESSAVVESEEEYTSATRQVYHFLHRHSIEVRVVLLSHGYGEMVAKMLRYFRIGHSSKLMDCPHSDEVDSAAEKRISHVDVFRNEDVTSAKARDICTDNTTSRFALAMYGSRKRPTVIDYTDFGGLSDRWVEFLLYMAYSVVGEHVEGYTFYAINCPRLTKSAIQRIEELVYLPLDIRFYTSRDFDHVSEIPSNLVDARAAFSDLKEAVKFPVLLRSGTTLAAYNADVYIGANFLQIINEDACDVIYYVPHFKGSPRLIIKKTRKNLHISANGSEYIICSPSSSMIRVLHLSVTAAEAQKFGAIVDLGCVTDDDCSKPSQLSGPVAANGVSGAPNALEDEPFIHDVSHKTENKGNPVHESICPGRLIFSALCDAMHECYAVRRRALEFYSVLPLSLGLQLSVPSPQQTLMPNQVFALADSAAKQHPELAICVVAGLASMGTNITEKAAQVAFPWVPYLVAETAEHREILRFEILKPLLQAVSEAPKTVGPILLEYFWPFLKDLPTMIADLLLDISMEASTESLEALRQIVASGISSERPHESREFAEALLARLYSNLRGKSDPTTTKWSEHSDWDEIRVCSILFSSVTLDYEAAELLFSEASFVLLILAGVGTPQLRASLHQMLINYLNVFIHSPNTSPSQRARLQQTRQELTSPRGDVLFGIQKDIHGGDPEWTSDDYTDYTPEMSEHLGRLLSDILNAVFSYRLSKYQELRVAIASRVMEFIDVNWPPLQRRCVLALVGAVRFLMPESVVHNLIRHLGMVLSESGDCTLVTRGELVTTFLRMFGETLECIPDTGGIYHQCLFWLSVVALATGSVSIQADAVRLLRESVKIAHFRGIFRDQSLADVYLASPPLISKSDKEGDASDDNILPLDIPTTKENFHVALAQLLVPALQQPGSQKLALECCDVLSKACPSEFVYAAFLYLCGEEGRIAARVPTGAYVDTDDAVAEWLGSKIKLDDPASIIVLALCAEVSGFSRSMNFSQTGPRLLDLVLAVKNRRIVNMISPLLRPTFLRLLKLDDYECERGLIKWSLSIFSRSLAERKAITNDTLTLHVLLEKLNMRPWFDNNYQIQPLFFENKFTETTRSALNSCKWLRVASSADSSWATSDHHTEMDKMDKLF